MRVIYVHVNLSCTHTFKIDVFYVYFCVNMHHNKSKYIYYGIKYALMNIGC